MHNTNYGFYLSNSNNNKKVHLYFFLSNKFVLFSKQTCLYKKMIKKNNIL